MDRHVFRDRIAAAALALVLVAGAAAQDEEPADAPQDAPAPDAAETEAQPASRPQIGDTLPETLPLRRLRDVDAEPGIARSALAGDPARPTVLLFWRVDCPVCKRYEKVLARLAADLHEDVRFVLVAGGDDVDADALRALLDRTSLAAVVVVDEEAATARALGVRVTPTALVADAEGVLRYVGPFDDDRRARGRDARPMLRPALDAVVAGEEPELASVRPFGSAVR